MKRKTKKKIKGFFTRPLVILFIAVLAWAFFAGLSTSFIISRVKREAVESTKDLLGNIMKKYERGQTVVEDVEIYHRLQLHGLKVIPVANSTEEIITGFVSNTSAKNVQGLKLKLTFRNIKGEILETKEYDKVLSGTLARGKIGNFMLTRQLIEPGEPEFAAERRRAVKVEGKITDFQLVK